MKPINSMLILQVILLLLVVAGNSYAQPSVPASQQTTEGMQTIASEASLAIVCMPSVVC